MSASGADVVVPLAPQVATRRPAHPWTTRPASSRFSVANGSPGRDVTASRRADVRSQCAAARSPPSGQGPCETRPVRRYLDRLEAHRFLTRRTRRATGWRSEELVVIDTLRHSSRIGSRRAPSDDASVIGLAEGVIVDRIPEEAADNRAAVFGDRIPAFDQPTLGILSTCHGNHDVGKRAHVAERQLELGILGARRTRQAIPTALHARTIHTFKAFMAKLPASGDGLLVVPRMSSLAPG